MPSSEHSTPSPKWLHYVRLSNPPSSPSPPASADNVAPDAIPRDTTSADMIAACKARINADLISAFREPCPPGTTPYITGIGLYTHIEGPRDPALPQEQDLPPQPEFLSLRQPTRSGNSGSMMDEEVRKLWADLRDVINDEDERIGKLELGLEELTKRYKGFPVPKGSTTPVQYEGGEREDTVMQDNGEAQVGGEVRPQASADANMQGTEDRRRRRLPPIMSTYAPDPRRRAR